MSRSVDQRTKREGEVLTNSLRLYLDARIPGLGQRQARNFIVVGYPGLHVVPDLPGRGGASGRDGKRNSGERTILEDYGDVAPRGPGLERVLSENPQSLQVILDALLDALRQEMAVEAEALGLREEEKELCEADTLVRRF